MDPMNKKDTAETESPIVDPFPKPQTIPSGWDLSELLTDSKAATGQQGHSTSRSDSSKEF